MRLIAVAITGGLLCLGCSKRDAPQLPPINLSIAGHSLLAEQAVSEDQQERGLMHRTSLPDGRGMLFVLSESASVCMWMKDTPIPLSAAFVGKHGQILQVLDMLANTEDQHCSKEPASFVIEAPLGWFAKNGATEGTLVTGLDRAGK